MNNKSHKRKESRLNKVFPVSAATQITLPESSKGAKKDFVKGLSALYLTKCDPVL